MSTGCFIITALKFAFINFIDGSIYVYRTLFGVIGRHGCWTQGEIYSYKIRLAGAKVFQAQAHIG